MNDSMTHKSNLVQHGKSNDYLELAAMLNSPEIETRQIVERLADHADLSLLLIKRANSPEFALRSQITRVEHAIAVLGRSKAAETLETNLRVDRANTHLRPHYRKP